MFQDVTCLILILLSDNQKIVSDSSGKTGATQVVLQGGYRQEV